MTYLWRYRITDMDRIRVTERLGVRLQASPPPGALAISAIECECPGGPNLVNELQLRRDLRSFCTVAANRRWRFSQRAATVRSRLSPPRRHLRNLHDPHNKDIDHHIDEKLGNLYGFLNSQDHEDRLCVTTGMSTTTRDIDTMASNCGISMEF